MAYTSGTANSFSDLKNSIEAFCVANGWTLSSDVLSKDGCFYQLAVLSQGSGAYPYLKLQGGTGQSGSTVTGVPTGSHNSASIASANGNVISFPINYEIHLFSNPNEVYCVIEYNTGFYQFLSFGRSSIQGIGGTGCWFTGSFVTNSDFTSLNASQCYILASGPEYANTDSRSGRYNVGLFFEGTGTGTACSFVHTGLDATPWRSSVNSSDLTGYRGAGYTVASLLIMLPNLSNQAEILLPIKPMALRSSGGLTAIVNLKNARYLRIDNVEPGDVIPYGSDQWKVYPFYKKDTGSRNGVGWFTGALHSGTFGCAIRYTGS